MSQSAGCALLADRHPSVIEGVRSLLATVFQTVVMVADEASLLQGVNRLEPRLAVVDLRLAARDPLQFLRELRAACPELQIIVMSDHFEPAVTQSLLNTGINGLIPKRDLGSDLLPAVETILAGGLYVSVAPHLRGT